MCRNRRERQGFTLLEMVIAITILSAIMVCVAVMLHSTGTVATLEGARNGIERANRKALDQMALELRDTSAARAQPALDGTSVRFSIPVPAYDVQLNINDLVNQLVLKTDGTIRYGFLERNSPALVTPRNGMITYQFVQNTLAGQPQVLSEPALRTDLNFDNDRVDQFAIGRIVRRTQIVGLPEVTDPVSMGISVAQPLGNPGGDVNGDGLADPIFQVDAPNNRIQVNLWAVRWDDNKNPHCVQSVTSICLRNR